MIFSVRRYALAAWLVAALTLGGCAEVPKESSWEVVDSATDPSWVLAIGSPKAHWGAGEAITIRTVLSYVGHLDCKTHQMRSDEPLTLERFKAGGYSADDPHAAFYEALQDDPLLRLPSGRWQLTARAVFSMPPPAGCSGRTVSLTASIVLTVE